MSTTTETRGRTPASPTADAGCRTGGGRARPALRVAVLGGGASGVLAAAHLLRAGREHGREVVVDVFEPTGRLGAGVAYGTGDPDHLLNVPAAGMSAWPDQPADFAQWAARRGLPLADGFARRPDYAEYLRGVLANARVAASPDSLRVHATAAVEVTGAGPRTVVGADGARVGADLVVLATGWSGAGHDDLPLHPQAVRDPWLPGALDAVPARGRVLVLGAGLSGIDVALGILRDGPGREVVLVSRSGELPRAHLRAPAPAWILGPAGMDRLPAAGRLDLPAVRTAVFAELAAARAAGVPWQAVMEALKPGVGSLWVRLGQDDRHDFLRVDLRRWDVHRHRMAPAVADTVAAHRRTGRLRVVAGEVGLTVRNSVLEARLDADGTTRTLRPAAVVSCRGWGAAGAGDPHGLGAGLIRRGTARVDPLALSFDTTVDGHLLDAGGRASADIVAIGPARRAATWESTAVGAIREQAAAIARVAVFDIAPLDTMR